MGFFIHPIIFLKEILNSKYVSKQWTETFVNLVYLKTVGCMFYIILSKFEFCKRDMDFETKSQKAIVIKLALNH